MNKLSHYAKLLRYPEGDINTHLEELGLDSQTLSGLNLGQLRELYTRTFDLQMVCYPYVGYHLFGESFKRGAFLALLIDKYKQFDFHFKADDSNPDNMEELPDHISLILEFISGLADKSEKQIIISDALIPALNGMLGNFGFEDELIFPVDQSPSKKDPLHSMPGEHERLELSLDAAPPDFCGGQGEDNFKSKEIEKWEGKRAKDNEQGLNKSNPYASILKSLLKDLEEIETELKGELAHA